MAIADIKNEASVLSTASKFKIARTSLIGKLSGKYPIALKIGPESVIKYGRERDTGRVGTWHCECWVAAWRCTIPCQETEQESTIYMGVIGEAFLKRHPLICQWISQKKRMLCCWFSKFEEYLKTFNNLDVVQVPVKYLTWTSQSTKAEQFLTTTRYNAWPHLWMEVHLPASEHY